MIAVLNKNPLLVIEFIIKNIKFLKYERHRLHKKLIENLPIHYIRGI